MIRSRPVAVVVVGVVLAAAGGLVMAADAREDVNTRLAERGDRVAAVIGLQLERYASASRAVAALRADDPTQVEWETRVERLGIASDLASVFNTASATLEEDGGERRLVIDLVAPLEPNRDAIGLDVLTVPDAAGAASRAVDGELVSMSDALTLVQEPDGQTGLVVYAPWYREDGSLGGVTDLVLRGQDFLDAVVGEVGDLGLQVADAGSGREVGSLEPSVGVDEDLMVVRTIMPLGQEWELEVTAPVGFASTAERFAGALTAAAVLALTALVAALVAVLQRREEHARREVEERTRELVATNAELAEALAAKDEFLAVVTHEFRTPIAVIQGFAETVAAGRMGDLPEPARRVLERIDRQARRLNGLVDNLLTAARLRAGDAAINPEVIELGALARAVAAQHPDITPLDVDIAQELFVEVDPGHAVRILDAIVSNAGKYGRAPVRIVGQVEGDEIALRISDSGDGIPDDVAQQIFQPFEQADHGDTRRSQGIGLGLSLARELCEQMGSSVALVDGELPGACFELRCPAASPTQDQEGPAVASRPSLIDEG